MVTATAGAGLLRALARRGAGVVSHPLYRIRLHGVFGIYRCVCVPGIVGRVTTDVNRPPLFGLPSPDDPHAAAALLARAQAAVGELSGFLEPLAALFAQRDESLYLVGGPVRDAMLGRLGNDLDFTTSARPEVIAEILSLIHI